MQAFAACVESFRTAPLRKARGADERVPGTGKTVHAPVSFLVTFEVQVEPPPNPVAGA
jgi:hypothetical protein